jgi:hypothetical protein
MSIGVVASGLKIAVDLEVPNGLGLALGPQKSMVFGLIVKWVDGSEILTNGAGWKREKTVLKECRKPSRARAADLMWVYSQVRFVRFRGAQRQGRVTHYMLLLLQPHPNSTSRRSDEECRTNQL